MISIFASILANSYLIMCFTTAGLRAGVGKVWGLGKFESRCIHLLVEGFPHSLLPTADPGPRPLSSPECSGLLRHGLGYWD